MESAHIFPYIPSGLKFEFLLVFHDDMTYFHNVGKSRYNFSLMYY